jgi:hypothetical protein
MPEVMAPPARPATPPMPGGSTAPATMQPESGGMQQRGKVIMGTLVPKLMVEAIRMLDPMSEEGRDALKALGILSKRFGHASDDLTRQEMKMLTERAGGMSQPGPENMAAMKSMIGQKNAGMGVGSPGPQAAPPPMAGAA